MIRGAQLSRTTDGTSAVGEQTQEIKSLMQVLVRPGMRRGRAILQEVMGGAGQDGSQCQWPVRKGCAQDVHG